MFCYQKNFVNPTLPVDEAQFSALVRATKWKEEIELYRQTGDARHKRRLPAFIFQAMFDVTKSRTGLKGAWRKQAATRLTGLVVMDVDHVENPLEKFGEWKTLDFSRLGILLVYVTPSGHGLKVVFKADAKKGNLIDNQHAMAKVLGVEVDEACKDASRMSFICKEEDILFINSDELFSYENMEFAEKYNAEYRSGRSAVTQAVADAGTGTGGAADNGGAVAADAAALTFRGRPYSEIIDEWWKQNGGVPQEGERNVKLYQLAVNLRAICDNDKAKLLRVMPRLGLDEQELQRIVESACKEPPKGLSKAMRAIVGRREATDLQAQNLDAQLETWGQEIEALSEDYPLLKDICKGLRRNQYPAAMFVAGGLLMTLMTRCTYRFYHRPEELRRLNCSVLIIGDPASGKSFATRLFKLLAAPIVAADKTGKEAINAYRELVKTKGANKEKPAKPKVVVRVHPARTSNAQFIQDMVNAVEVVDGEEMQLHMLTFDTELDNTVSVQKGGSWIDKFSMELKAFHNEEDGQAYSNVDSIMQDFNVTWNYIYTGTPIALKKKVNEQNFGSGLATRLTCIPLPATNFEMMARESYIDFESDGRLKQWAYLLDRMKGELSLQKIVDELYEWTARRMADAKDNDSKADEMLLKRCAYHGLNFSAPFIVMRHWKEIHQDGTFFCGTFETDETDWRLAELMVNIQYACQRYYFGALAEKYFDDKTREAAANVQRRQKTIEGFERLPEVFTVDDVVRCFNLNNSAAGRTRINRLVKDHLAEKIEDFVDNGTSKAKYRKIGHMI